MLRGSRTQLGSGPAALTCEARDGDLYRTFIRRCVRLRLTLACASQPLDDVLTVHEGFSDKKHSCGLEHCEFQITTERQVLLFRAGSREERDAWIENLKPIMQGYLLHALITAQGVRLHPPTSPSCPH